MYTFRLRLHWSLFPTVQLTIFQCWPTEIMARRRSGDKPLSEPMVVNSLTHICVTRPQWVNKACQGQFIEADTKWLPFSGRHFKFILLTKSVMCLSGFHLILFPRAQFTISHQWVGNGLAPKRRHAIFWSDDCLVYWVPTTMTKLFFNQSEGLHFFFAKLVMFSSEHKCITPASISHIHIRDTNLLITLCSRLPSVILITVTS